MYFITSRMPIECGKAQRGHGKPFTFDLEDNASGQEFFCCRKTGKNAHVELGGKPMLSALKNEPYRQVLLYLHGFSNLPDDIFANAQEFQDLCDAKKKHEVLVLPVIWPCDNKLGIVRDYWDDQKSADLSAFALARMMQRFMEWRNSEESNPADDPCLKRINVLAHSMGNRVLRLGKQARRSARRRDDCVLEAAARRSQGCLKVLFTRSAPGGLSPCKTPRPCP